MVWELDKTVLCNDSVKSGGWILTCGPHGGRRWVAMVSWGVDTTAIRAPGTHGHPLIKCKLIILNAEFPVGTAVGQFSHWYEVNPHHKVSSGAEKQTCRWDSNVCHHITWKVKDWEYWNEKRKFNFVHTPKHIQHWTIIYFLIFMLFSRFCLC